MDSKLFREMDFCTNHLSLINISKQNLTCRPVALTYFLLKEATCMMKTETWWETIFSGVLEIGINKEKLVELADESFLYFTQPDRELEEQPNP